MSSFFSRHGSGDVNATTIKDISTRLDVAKRNLEDLRIIRLVETLTKLQDLLDHCKNNRNKDAIQKFTSLLTSSIDDVLEPILTERKRGEVEISKALTYQLEAFFGALFHEVPVQPPSSMSRLSRWDISGALTAVNPSMEEALNRFHSQGKIRCDIRRQDNRRVLDLDQSGQTQGDQEHPAQPVPHTGPNVLEPTTDGILKVLPNFRILLLGKSGVGKSSLINKIFGISTAEVADFTAGKASIDREFTSNANSHFILHDSEGYEPGSIDQFKIVQDFIMERSQHPDITQQIHAIWLCTSTPMSGGRVFEVGDEMLFSMDLGPVPLIVVYTKYDELIADITIKICNDEGMDDDAKRRVVVKEMAAQRFKTNCVKPLEDAYKKLGRTDLPPYISVSGKPMYANTISRLVQLTRKEVSATAWLTWAIAQRADPATSIEASIDVGRRRFWTGLESGLYFREKTLKRCLDTVHDDIVRVWNFYDPKKFLIGEKFKGMMTRGVDDVVDLVEKDPVLPKKKKKSFFGLLSRSSPATAPRDTTTEQVDFPKWVFEIYDQSPGVLRCIMAYIVDLTMVMQRLFYLLRDRGIQPLPEELLQNAFDNISHSEQKTAVHGDIRDFVQQGDLQAKDKVTNKVVQLIGRYRITPDDGVESS